MTGHLMRALLVASLIVAAPLALPAQAHTTSAVVELRRALLRHDWAALEHGLAVRQLRGDQDSEVEFRYVFAFDAFASGDSALQQHLDAWVAAEPTIAIARAARGLYFVRMAAAAKPLDEVHPSAAATREISRWLALATADADAALRLDSSEFMAHVIRLGMIPLQWRGRETRDAYEAAVGLRPSSLHARALYIETLTPRFENPPSRMARFADSAQRHASVNPRLRVLRGMAAYERANDLAAREQHAAAIREFTIALAFGDYWRFRYERGMEYFRVDSLAKALIDLNRALAERPGYVPSLVGRALTFAHLARQLEGIERVRLMRRADEDVRVAALLDARDEDVRGILNGGAPPGGWATPPQPVGGALVAVSPAPDALAPLGRPADLLTLHTLLLARNYGALDSAMAARRAEARADPARENRYVYAFDVFGSGDPALDAPIDAWVAHDTTRAIAWAARAHHRVARAWRARGTSFANELSVTQQERLHDWLRLAAGDAMQAASLDSTDIAGHLAMLDVTMLRGDDALGLRVVRDAIRRLPGSMLVRARYMYSLRPNWGGSLADMETFAATQQRDLRLNPHMTTLLGLADLERGETLAGDDQLQPAVAAYGRALSHGRHWRAFYDRARVYRDIEEPERTLADLEQAVAERPASATLLAWRAVANLELSYERYGPAAQALVRRARDDYRLAITFDSTARDVGWVGKTFPELTSDARSARSRRR